MINLAKITNQASDRHKNNKCLTVIVGGALTNLTKITNKSKSNESSKSLKLQYQETILEDEKGRGAHKYKQNTRNNKSSETSNQASDGFNNDNCSRRRREEVPRNIELTRLFCIIKIANEASDTFSKPALQTIQIVSVTSGHG